MMNDNDLFDKMEREVYCDAEGRTICRLCDEPLNGHCVYFPRLGIFCEKCVRKALAKAIHDWDCAAE